MRLKCQLYSTDKANDHQSTQNEVSMVSKIPFIQMYSHNKQGTNGKFKFYVKKSIYSCFHFIFNIQKWDYIYIDFINKNEEKLEKSQNTNTIPKIYKIKK